VGGEPEAGLPLLEREIASPHPWVMLQAARAMHDIGLHALPAVDRIESVRKTLQGGVKKNGLRRYRDFNYASFTGWALEGALVNCGVAKPEDF
jgi:hypothetical protein